MTQETTQCPDCETEMRAIKLIDNTGMTGSTEIAYAAADAQRDWFTGHYHAKGVLGAKMCPSCGRVTLHAKRK